MWTFREQMILDCTVSTLWHRWFIFSKVAPRILYSTYTQKEIYILKNTARLSIWTCSYVINLIKNLFQEIGLYTKNSCCFYIDHFTKSVLPGMSILTFRAWNILSIYSIYLSNDLWEIWCSEDFFMGDGNCKSNQEE